MVSAPVCAMWNDRSVAAMAFVNASRALLAPVVSDAAGSGVAGGVADGPGDGLDPVIAADRVGAADVVVAADADGATDAGPTVTFVAPHAATRSRETAALSMTRRPGNDIRRRLVRR